MERCGISKAMVASKKTAILQPEGSLTMLEGVGVPEHHHFSVLVSSASVE